MKKYDIIEHLHIRDGTFQTPNVKYWITDGSSTYLHKDFTLNPNCGLQNMYDSLEEAEIALKNFKENIEFIKEGEMVL